MILILGASSFIGRRLLASLGPSRAVGTYRSNPLDGGIYFDSTTMNLADVLPAGANFSHAVLLYAEADVDACKRDLERSRELNVHSTRRAIDDLMRLGIKPIFTSSEYVFDGSKGSYTEVDPANPTTVYGSQKLEIESYLAQHCDDYVVLRLAKVFGSDPEEDSILTGWLKQIRAGAEIRCASDQVFSPIHIDDVVAATEAAIRLELRGVYHTSNAESCDRLAMLQTLLGCLGATARVVECSIRDFDFLDSRPLDLSMRPEKLMGSTGIVPRSILSCCEEFATRAGAIAPEADR